MDYEQTLMTKVAWYYYFEEMTQQKVAELMGISRMRVIKLLEKAKQTGIIQLQLRKEGHARMELEQKLMSTFSLKDVFIVPAAENPRHVNAGISKAASMYINERLTNGAVINMGYGNTPSRILNQLAMMAEHPITCIALTGGVSYYLPDARSNVFNAKLHLVPAPLLTSSKEMAHAMRNETSVSEVSRMSELAQMTVIGIGSMHESATIFKTGVLSHNDYLYLGMQGAVGDVLSHFIDDQGQLIKTPIEERLISTSLEKLKKLNNVIGVAAGLHKAKAIRAVLNGQYLDVLITDDRTAEAILDIEPFN